MGINLNELAKQVTIVEGQSKSTNIAQVKEVMKILFQKLAKMTITEVAQILEKYKR